ncbi:MAG TPA: histidine kinase N-terminal 7TM domain-containing protein [Mycobacteriales bacterium]|nr:histidine kinase N-terminal 7TM domain-containing protein [Mycobacteriales bacterium]
MTKQRAIAAALSAVSVAGWVAGVAITVGWGSGWGGVPDALGGELFGLPFVLVGLVVTVRRPEHPIGWGFAAAGLCFSLQLVADTYADAALLHHADLPAGAYIGNVTQWIFAPAITFGYTLPFLWFPDGKLLSRRWRWVAAAGCVGTLAMIVVNILAPGPLNNYPHVRNPWGVSLAGSGALEATGFATYVGAMFAAAIAIVIRYRRSRGFERLQMRWLMVGVAWSVVSLALQLVLALTAGDVGPSVLLLGVLPVCAGVAILRYRLFDIDRVISRTVSYVIVTGVLVGGYIGVVALATRLLPFSSSVGVAASTLVVAAAFNPVRRQVQGVVDRRFNRQRYDAVRTVDAFAARLRDEVDVDVVHRDLLDVTTRAMQPATISLWVSG